jgi:tRNA threonylcarbamoyladenosine biosynthesis protein TsaE
MDRQSTQNEVSQAVTLSELPAVATSLLTAAGAHRVWLLKGEMGSGKTTLVKYVCAALGVTSTTASPTFSIVNEYALPSGEPVYHFDCYRLKNEWAALDIGIEEYLASGQYCLIEWPEKIAHLLPDHTFVVELRKLDPQTRLITYHA